MATTDDTDIAPPGVLGGEPATTGGKAGSCGNALKHGLCSETILPEVLRPGLVNAYRQRLRLEFRPETATEEVLVDELARHAARLQFGEDAEEAVLREGGLQLVSVLQGTTEGNLAENGDAILSAAAATEVLERLSRYRRGHEKAFYAALQWLCQRRKAEPKRHPQQAEAVRPRFTTEEACEAYLRQRFDWGSWRCSRCGHTKGHWLGARRCWECGKCKRQAGLRAGTVMHRSPLPLLTWFGAIAHVLSSPGLTAKDLAGRLALKRPATSRKILRKIRTAAAAKDATELLAGLDRVVGSGRA